MGGAGATVSRALRLLEGGFLDDGRTVEDLADALGMTARHLRRLFDRYAGVSPTAVATTRRVQRAKALVDGTILPMSVIAFTAGFASIRRFDAAFRAVYRRPLSAGPGSGGDRGGRIASAIVDTRTRAPYGARAGRECPWESDSDVLTGASHFPSPSFARVVRQGNAF